MGRHQNKLDLTETSPGHCPGGYMRVTMHDTSFQQTRPAKKSKSDATASTGGSSASAQFEELMEQELRLKWEAAERASKLKPKKTAH
ncbi:hypothetical protein Tco_0461627 [Tanacetum coccineum]